LIWKNIKSNYIFVLRDEVKKMDNGKRLLNEIFAEIGTWWTKRREKISLLLPLVILNFPIRYTQYFGGLLLVKGMASHLD
jgi:hypothetical protein